MFVINDAQSFAYYDKLLPINDDVCCCCAVINS